MLIWITVILLKFRIYLMFHNLTTTRGTNICIFVSFIAKIYMSSCLPIAINHNNNKELYIFLNGKLISKKIYVFANLNI